MNRLKKQIAQWMLCAFGVFTLSACDKVDLYERLENIPQAAWKSNHKPEFKFDISDTTSMYNVFVTVRHANTYAYNNIWLESTLQLPGDSTVSQQKLDLQLAGTDGWLGVGMDDIYMSRIKITATPQRFPRSGEVKFTLAQVMRQDPLPGILQAGIRVEKVK